MTELFIEIPSYFVTKPRFDFINFGNKNHAFYEPNLQVSQL